MDMDMARHGMSRPGQARLGMAGAARLGVARQGLARHGVAGMVKAIDNPGGPVTDNYDPFDQDTWPPCEACGRRQVHRHGCPAITVTVGALAATAAALTIAAHAAMGLW